MKKSNIFTRIFANRTPMSDAEKGLVYSLPGAARPDQKEMERAFARLFATQDGQRVLAYLHSLTFQRVQGTAATDAQLRYMEGQRSLLAAILRLIERGRQG